MTSGISEGAWNNVLISTVIFTLAFLITTILHELAHAVTGLTLGSEPVLHDTFVEHHGLSRSGEAITAAAGPIFSLVQGIVLLVGKQHSQIRSAPRLLQLFLLWMAIHGLVNFFGYLITTPFARHGDIGQVAEYFGLSAPASFGLVAAGIAANIGIGVFAAWSFLELAPSAQLLTSAAARQSYLMHTAVLPWIAGTVLIVAIRYPPPFWIIFIYPATSGLFTLVSWKQAARILDVTPNPGAAVQDSAWLWTATLVAVIILFRFVLAPGIRLGR